MEALTPTWSRRHAPGHDEAPHPVRGGALGERYGWLAGKVSQVNGTPGRLRRLGTCGFLAALPLALLMDYGSPIFWFLWALTLLALVAFPALHLAAWYLEYTAGNKPEWE